MMRTTISIPEPFYQRVKEILPEKGFTTVNDYLLDLLRHQIDANGEKRQTPVNNSHQNDAPQIKVKQNGKPVPTRKPKDEKLGEMCEHGYLGKLCTHEKCRIKYR